MRWIHKLADLEWTKLDERVEHVDVQHNLRIWHIAAEMREHLMEFYRELPKLQQESWAFRYPQFIVLVLYLM